MKEASGLHIDEHMGFRRRLWRVQQWAIPFMILIVVLALLGGFGYGYLGQGKAGDETDAVWLSYDRLAQAQAPTELTAHITRIEGDKVQLWIGSDFLSQVTIDRIQPEPAESKLEHDRVVFEYPVAANAKSVEIAIHYTPNEPGTLDARIGLVDQASQQARVFVYP